MGEEDWKNAATCAGNLSELHLALGELARAEALALKAVTYADASGEAFERLVMRTTYADALHQLGRNDDSRELFAEAERIQVAWEPRYPFLFSLRGYLYCDLLLANGRTDEVLRRAARTLKTAELNHRVLDIALDHVSLGRAHFAASPPNLAATEPHLRMAVDGLRASGRTDLLPVGLVARAAYHRVRDDLPRAWKDLDTVATLVRRGGLRLVEADLALEQARCHLAARAVDEARDALVRARGLITAMDYGRRRPELAALEAELGDGGAANGVTE